MPRASRDIRYALAGPVFIMLKVEVSYRGLVALGAALLTLWALVRLWPVLLLVVTAFIFMAALLPYVEWLVRRGVNRIVAVLLILLTVFAGLGSVVAIVAPAMFDEFRDLRSNLPQYASDFEQFMQNFGFDTERWDLPERAAEIKWDEIISGSQAVDFGQRCILQRHRDGGEHGAQRRNDEKRCR